MDTPFLYQLLGDDEKGFVDIHGSFGRGFNEGGIHRLRVLRGTILFDLPLLCEICLVAVQREETRGGQGAWCWWQDDREEALEWAVSLNHTRQPIW